MEIAMNLIRDKGWINVILCSDAKRAIDEIILDDVVHNAPSLITKCRDLRTELHLDMRFESKDSNVVADALAKDTRCHLEIMNEISILNEPPLICNDAFVRDLTLCSENSVVNLAGDVPAGTPCLRFEIEFFRFFALEYGVAPRMEHHGNVVDLASDRFNINSQLEHLQAKYVGTGHADLNRFEWAVNIQRDSYASYVGHYPMLAYFAVAENESIGRERYNFMQKMLLPCGLPPEREDD
uniref:Uncharacterized protein n=1 Tax=Chenopodium quinoa TaxID=63459 RepID=A0A803MBP3_CHEQI